jgi:hypothetical protein
MKSIGKNFRRLATIVSLVASMNFACAGPYVFWVNNDFDRSHTVDLTDTEQDDLKIAPTSDCNYKVGGNRVIPCARDLEDFARLWMAGVDSNLVAALPTNSTLTLSWNDVEGEPTIDLFAAADPGIGYLTNATIAAKQIDPAQCPYIGRLGPGQQIQFTKSTWRTNQFIWCGVKYGGGGLTLTIADGNGNTLAQTKSYIALVDIKQMYERWTVGEVWRLGVTNTARLGVEGPPGSLPFQYSPPTDTNTPYILLVHGWNMETWDKDHFAETAFKRLYWQGYQGRFGFFRWPTGNRFNSIISVAFDARNYDNSESNAWASARGLLNKLTELNAQYPNHVYLMAHSMGNVVAGEALRLATNQVVNTFIAMEAAIPAHCYDASATTNSTRSVPNRYAYYWTDSSPRYFNGAVGAGAYVNFYNTNDYALGYWVVNQNLKPDNGLPYPGYHYSVSSLHPNGFYKQFGSGTNDFHNLNFPSDTYEIFAYAAPAWSYALGAQANVGGFAQQNLIGVWPADQHPGHDYSAHAWHSAQFRSDIISQWKFWDYALGQQGFDLK